MLVEPYVRGLAAELKARLGGGHSRPEGNRPRSGGQGQAEADALAAA